jgi:hypothetical protein
MSTRAQTSSDRWLFDTLRLNPITLDVDSTVLTSWGSQIEGAAKGYNTKNKGRATLHRATTSSALSSPPWRTWGRPAWACCVLTAASMTKRSWAIKTFTTGLDAAAYENNAMVQAAVERKFEVIGEALSQLSLLDADMAAQLPDLITVVQALLNELGSAFYPCSVLRLQTCASKAPIKSSSAPTGPSQPQSTHK